MDYIFIYIPNDNKKNHPICRIKLWVEKFRMHQSKFYKSTQSFLANEQDNMVIKLWSITKTYNQIFFFVVLFIFLSNHCPYVLFFNHYKWALCVRARAPVMCLVHHRARCALPKTFNNQLDILRFMKRLTPSHTHTHIHTQTHIK